MLAERASSTLKWVDVGNEVAMPRPRRVARLDPRFEVEGLEFRFGGLGFRVWCVRSSVSGSGLGVEGLGFPMIIRLLVPC